MVLASEEACAVFFDRADPSSSMFRALQEKLDMIQRFKKQFELNREVSQKREVFSLKYTHHSFLYI